MQQKPSIFQTPKSSLSAKAIGPPAQQVNFATPNWNTIISKKSGLI
jgi:hypothetical protein